MSFFFLVHFVNAKMLMYEFCLFVYFSAPDPTAAVPYMAAKCIDLQKDHHKTKWFIPWGPDQCNKLRDLDEAVNRQIEANNIVFAIHIPLPKNEMSPWFQFILCILHMDIAFKSNNQISK